ncbi:MAG: AlwI family type II restriction endonuclease [Elusimicrobiales bacterium]|nr:AlwI family type II restriction endonuclease [Elusimicrobiales bacterium]
MANFTYKSYAWNIGTTSFRMADFHRKNEEQLILLHKFWKLPENAGLSWKSSPETQAKYYKFLLENGFVSGNIMQDKDKQAKTARQKTSGLTEIGLIDENRRITPAGKKLLQAALSQDFSADNGFLLPKDSFIYFRQLLKMDCRTKDWTARPYLITGMAIKKCGGFLTEDEFAYLLPLCVSKEISEEIISKIRQGRGGIICADEIISSAVLSRYSYPAALDYFLKSNASDEDILLIGMNRDGIRHDSCYPPLYRALRKTFLQKNKNSVGELYQAAKNVKNAPGALWRKLLFKKSNKNISYEDLTENDFSGVQSEEDFRRVFFKYLHLHKIKATLGDYKDLNRRYLKATDTIVFEDGKVSFAPIFRSYFNTKAGDIFKDSFIPYSGDIAKDSSLEEINKCLNFDIDSVIMQFNKENGTEAKTAKDLQGIIDFKRHEKFRIIADSRFPDETLLKILGSFETRAEDSWIISLAGGEADVPTVFEYIIGIIWYRLSGYKGKILDYMNLSLDAELMPRTHAGGGEADIIYKYGKTSSYPAHSLLIECTLMEGTTQRHGEMEPVSRHLANYMIDSGDMQSYSAFISNNLHPSVISDFRMRRNNPFYRNKTEFVDSMKIMPISTEDLKNIIKISWNIKTFIRFLTRHLKTIR